MNDFADYFAVFCAGILSNALLYEPTHREGFPELARYSIGVLIVVLLYGVLTGKWQVVKQVFDVFTVYAFGLGSMRIFKGLFFNG